VPELKQMKASSFAISPSAYLGCTKSALPVLVTPSTSIVVALSLEPLVDKREIVGLALVDFNAACRLGNKPSPTNTRFGWAIEIACASSCFESEILSTFES